MRAKSYIVDPNKLLRMRGLLKLQLIMCCLIPAARGSAAGFSELFYSGRWATAKLWLLERRDLMEKTDYYTKHLQVGYFLNEHELCRAYCDSLRQAPGYGQSVTARLTYHILTSKYYQYYRRQDDARWHAGQALKLAAAIGNRFQQCLANAQMAMALRYCDSGEDRVQRDRFMKLAKDAIPLLPDSFYLYKAKLVQALELIEVDKLSKGQNTPENRNRITENLLVSSRYILRHHANHPQLVHNYMLAGFIRVAVDPDSALSWYGKAGDMLAAINDGHHGILIYHASSFIHLMEVAYELKYRQTGNIDYLNKAIVWAKQNMDLDDLKRQYEGYYLYRRFTDHYNPPPEQRIAKLYLILYKETQNKNYLSFATKYAEYFRHKPIMQAGLHPEGASMLEGMAAIEKGQRAPYRVKADHSGNMITRPATVARLLKEKQAIIAYFSYLNEYEDSVWMMIECIEPHRNTVFVEKYARRDIDSLSPGIYRSVEKADPAAYKAYASRAYNLFLAPALNTIAPQTDHLFIIPPACFGTPLQFDGLLTDEHGDRFGQFSYVFDRFNISYVSSFTHFTSHYHQDVPVHHVDIWNPDYAGTQLAELTENRLINAGIEAHFNARYLSGTSKKELLDGLFSGEILQVSGHADASFDELKRPRIYTGLPRDSVLFDTDVERLNVRTALVIYAACKSNLGHIQHNGMADGFTRATLSAGAGGTVCTFYNVEESVTARLLVSFYDHLSQGCSASEALYRAKAELKRANPDPRLWQAYLYTGAEQHFSGRNKPEWIMFGIACLLFALCSYLSLKTKLY